MKVLHNYMKANGLRAPFPTDESREPGQSVIHPSTDGDHVVPDVRYRKRKAVQKLPLISRLHLNPTCLWFVYDPPPFPIADPALLI